MPQEAGNLLETPGQGAPQGQSLLSQEGTTGQGSPAGSPAGSPNPPDPWAADGWEKLVPEKFRDDAGVKTRELAKSYMQLEKRIGTGDLPPKTATDYRLEYKLPEGVELDPEQEKSFLAACHAAGMTNKQVQTAVNRYSSLVEGMTKAQAEAAPSKEKTEAALRKVWGESYDEEIKFAQMAFGRLADDEIKREAGRIGNDPAVVRLLAKIGRGLREDSPPTGAPSASAEDIDALMKSPAYFNPKDPQHEVVKAKVTAYFQQATKKR